MRVPGRSNAQQEAVALYRFLRSRGLEPSMNSICRALRDQGLRFRDADIYRALDPFVGPHPGRKREAIGNQKTRTPAAVGTQPGSTRAAASREKEVSLVEIASGTPYPQRGCSQPRLALVDPAEAAARALLDMMWPVVAQRLGGVMTQRAWRTRNKRIALDLVRAGVPPERVLVAHAELSRKAGEAIYMLSRVQDALVRERPPAVATKPADDDPVWLTEAFERGHQAQEMPA